MSSLDQSATVEQLKNLPQQARLLIYQLLREDHIGTNVGGARLLLQNNKVTSVSVYPHGLRGLLAGEAGSDFSNLDKACGTIGTSVLCRCRNAVIRVFRDLFDGTSEQMAAARTVFGMLRIEFTVTSSHYSSAREALTEYLQENSCEDILSEDATKRAQACLLYLDRNHIKVRRLRIELVMQSLIHTILDFHKIIPTLGTKSTASERRKQKLPAKDRPQILRILMELGSRNERMSGYEVDFYG